MPSSLHPIRVSPRVVGNRFSKTAVFVWALVCLTGMSAKASADFVFDTGTVASSDGSLHGQADFQVGTGTITITITNLQPNMVSVGQAISGLSFAVANPAASSFTLNSISGDVVNVNSKGTVTDLGNTTYSGTTGSTTLADGRWHLTSPSSSDLIALGNGQPDHLVLGPPNSSGMYPNANGSIANGQFNPFFENSVTLVLSAPGITSNSTIGDVVFDFGTAKYEHLAPGDLISTAVPAPSSLLLCGLGGLCLLGFLVVSRRRRAAA